MTIHVELGASSYDIELCRGALERAGELINLNRKVMVVTDSGVPAEYADTVRNLAKEGYQVTVPQGEESKCFANLEYMLAAMLDAGFTRRDAVVAVGGGVVGDLAGFAAATVLRGVDYVQIPTTLLAQVDSSVGGKVAIDLPAGKNLAGAFWQPKLVLMDPDCLNTLSDKIFSDGMAEVIKYGCIRDDKFFRFLLNCGGRPGVMEHIEQVLYTCCDIKRQVVLCDERDTGLRMILNFGHTVGHAFELAGNYRDWTHGQGVAAGMVWAARLGEALGITPAGTQNHIRLALEQYSLPTHTPCPWQTMVEAVGLDKKRAQGGISFVLLTAPGRAEPVKMETETLLEQLKKLHEETA
jgi:3-dehydroquinate synthase